MLSLSTSFFDTPLCLALKLSPGATLGHSGMVIGGFLAYHTFSICSLMTSMA